jgi:hypothetical protein
MVTTSNPFPSPQQRQEPAACAGLRRSLLIEAGEQFPIEASPFQPLVQRLGGSLRELLAHCHTLVAEGATLGLRVRWDEALHRCGVRLVLRGQAWPLEGDAALALTTLVPSLTVCYRVESIMTVGEPLGAAARPSGWLDVWAVDPGRLQAQVGRLREATPGLAWSAVPLTGAPAPCRCAQGLGGPCADPALARLCEQGIPVVAHPYRVLAQRLGRTEREVVLALRRWRRGGQLAALGLVPAKPPPHGVAHVALLRANANSEVIPWRLQPLNLPPHATAEAKVRALRSARLEGRVQAVLTVHARCVRPAPMLFDDSDAPVHADPVS